MVYPIEIIVRPGNPDFLDLPWGVPLPEWADHCTRLEQVPRGLSRHPVLFVNYDGVLYALKEMAPGAAEQEYELLRQAEEANLPAVSPVGHVLTATSQGNASVLVTRYLESSLPYRMLFMSQGMERYRQYLLDAIAGLLVQTAFEWACFGGTARSPIRSSGGMPAHCKPIWSTPKQPRSTLAISPLRCVSTTLQIMDAKFSGRVWRAAR